MSTDSGVKFQRKSKGYDPHEVDAAFNKMSKEISALKDHIENLNTLITQYKNTIEKYDEKIREMDINAKRIEEEWDKKNQYYDSIMKNAAILLEQKIEDAHRNAVETTENDQQGSELASGQTEVDIKKDRGESSSLSPDTLASIGTAGQYLDDLEKLIDKARKDDISHGN